jgi:dienelactone hydrolase
MGQPAGKLSKFVVTLTFVALICASAWGQTQSNPGAKPLPVGEIIESQPCAAFPTENYALYLPSAYNPAKVWPIIYAFDPLAYGKVPVKLYKDAAEKYGFIIAASNNSRNFQADATSKAAQAVWEDTHTRLSIDPRRVYMMGFSGGARVATTLAIRCEPCAVAGVISHGAGYPGTFPPSEKDRFAYFAFVGNKDFNLPEVMELGQKKEEWGAAYRLKVFDGEHQWAPPAIFVEALEWLRLKATQAGSAPPDSAFIDQLFARTLKEAEDATRRKDAFAQFEAYYSLASDFSGLKDVSQYQAKLAALKSSPELKQALKKEQEQIDQQRSLTQQLSSNISQVGETSLDVQPDLRAAIVEGMTSLKNKAEHSKSEDIRLVQLRAFNDLWAQGIEAGQAELENKRYDKAEYYFQMMSSISPNEPWPVLLLAETSVARGDTKRALKDLHEAVKRGLKNPDAIDKDTNLERLRSEPEFQQIVAELKAKRESQPAQ